MIDIPESTFARLQKHARPFVDTPASVIERALDALERTGPKPATETPTAGASDKLLEFPANSAPNLTHTRVLAASFEGHSVQPKWNALLRHVHEVAFRRAGSFEALSKMTVARLHKGTKTEEGFQPLGGLGFSIQGVAANDAWRAILHLARALGSPVEVEFEWRAKEDAQHPGRRGRMAWSPAE